MKYHSILPEPSSTEPSRFTAMFKESIELKSSWTKRNLSGRLKGRRINRLKSSVSPYYQNSTIRIGSTGHEKINISNVS